MHSILRLIWELPEINCGLSFMCATYLVGGHDALLHAEFLVKRGERHECNSGGAVGVGDELLALARVYVNLGDHEGHAGVHSPRGGVVDHHGARLSTSSVYRRCARWKKWMLENVGSWVFKRCTHHAMQLEIKNLVATLITASSSK